MRTARAVEQWQTWELFFASEVNEEHSPIAERVLSALKSPYVKATLEFMNFVLDELVGLNGLFQSDYFQLHALHPELFRVPKCLH